MVMQFAQFLDHDLTMTPIHKGFAESIPSCRACDSARTVHPECNPFPVPPNDHFYPTANISTGARLCIPSMRSLPGQQHLGPREQVNQNTGFLDASVVYGENNCIANILRGFSGRMNITSHPNRGKDLLPQSRTHPECKAPSGYCFIGGDGRASEQPGLAVMHTMWVREHNRVMEGLRQVNPHWDAEKLFQVYFQAPTSYIIINLI
jgi:peroxidase